MFGKQTPHLIDEVLSGIDAGEVDKVRQAAHKLKSSAATLGARRLSLSAAEIEGAARAGRLGPAAGAAGRIRAEFEEANRSLAESLAAEPSS